MVCRVEEGGDEVTPSGGQGGDALTIQAQGVVGAVSLHPIPWKSGDVRNAPMAFIPRNPLEWGGGALEKGCYLLATV